MKRFLLVVLLCSNAYFLNGSEATVFIPEKSVRKIYNDMQRELTSFNGKLPTQGAPERTKADLAVKTFIKEFNKLVKQGENANPSSSGELITLPKKALAEIIENNTQRFGYAIAAKLSWTDYLFANDILELCAQNKSNLFK